MIVSTLLNLYIVPVLYVFINNILNRGGKRPIAEDPEHSDYPGTGSASVARTDANGISVNRDVSSDLI
jgi:hypothetical protein